MAKRNTSLRQKARALRIKGHSYNKISKLLSIPKSTLHYWVYDLPKSPFQLNPKLQLAHLAKIRILAQRVLRDQKLNRIEAIRQKVLQDVKGFPLENVGVQKALAAVLYWAEGTKTERSIFQFANTDPALSLLFLTLLKNGYDVSTENIKIRLHLHHYHNVSKARRFWAKVLDIPESQFEKIFIKSRKNTKRKRKNFAGICFIRYRKGAEELKQRLLMTARAIQTEITNTPDMPKFIFKENP